MEAIREPVIQYGDRHHDGFVDASEFRTIQQAAPMFKRGLDLAYFDENRDGRASRDEFVNKPNPLFARYDKNHDCKVTSQELKDPSGAQQAPPAGKRGMRGDR